MTGADEGDDIGAHLDVGEPRPGLGVGGLEEEREEVIRGRLAPGPSRARRVSISSPTTSSKKRSAGRARQRPSRGSHSGMPKTSSGIERAERLEIARDGAPERVRIALEPVREDRPLEHVERDARHLEGDVERCGRRAGASAAPGARPLAIMAGTKPRDVARREERREGAPLQPPLLAFGREQAVAEPGREHAALQVVLAVVRGVVDEDVPDRRRVAARR